MKGNEPLIKSVHLITETPENIFSINTNEVFERDTAKIAIGAVIVLGKLSEFKFMFKVKRLTYNLKFCNTRNENNSIKVLWEISCGIIWRSRGKFRV